mgnify:FL=1
MFTSLLDRAVFVSPTSSVTLVAAAALIALAGLLTAARRLRRTTAAVPLLYAAAAVVGTAAAAILREPFSAYASAVLAVAPTPALLGAKRPQAAAWQVIVLTLVAVLLLPVVQGWAFGDGRPRIHALCQLIVAALLFIGAAYYLPTRFAGPALAVVAAQAAVAWGPLFEFHEPRLLVEQGPLVGLLAAAGAVAWCFRPADRSATVGLARLWCDFCDLYGVVWGLRVAERMNDAARRHGRPVEFAWKSIEWRTAEAPPDPDAAHRIERELRSLLRRFVDHDWIARRMNPPARPPNGCTSSEPRA